MTSKFCVQFNMYFLVLCAIILFVAAPVQVLEAADVTFWPSMYSPDWNYYIKSVTTYSDAVTDTDGTVYSTDYAYCPFSGQFVSYSETSLLGGYSYSGTLGIDYNGYVSGATATLINGKSVSTVSNTTSTPPYSKVYAQVDSVEFIIDGTSYTPFITKTALSRGSAYFTFKDLYVSATNRFLVRINISGYVVFNLGRANTHSSIDRVYVMADPSIGAAGLSYELKGTTSGFNDNINDFDNAMDTGSDAEDALTDTAMEHINSYEFEDLSSGAGMASALSFYSSVVMAGYTALGDFKQLFGIVFALIIITVLLRIRRDSS